MPCPRNTIFNETIYYFFEFTALSSSQIHHHFPTHPNVNVCHLLSFFNNPNSICAAYMFFRMALFAGAWSTYQRTHLQRNLSFPSPDIIICHCSWTLPSPCYSVDWLDRVQANIAAVRSRVHPLYPEGTDSFHHPLTSGSSSVFHLSPLMVLDPMGMGDVVSECLIQMYHFVTATLAWCDFLC